MNKNLKISYILFFVFSAIVIAFRTLAGFFSGVGINFVALLGLVFAVLALSFNDKTIMKRVKDLFFIACVFCMLELIVYFACEFGHGENLLGFDIYQNIISFLGMLLLAYTYFRYVSEMTNKRYKFIEILLGNEKRSVKEKRAKEVSNGSLEEKPNNKETATEEENVIVIETEE